MTQETYQGWTNYETWLIKLWIDNEQSSQNYWLEAAKTADNPTELADQLKDEYEGAMPELNGVWYDLLATSIGEVDWYEIAESLIDEVEENRRCEITQMIEVGPTSSGSTKLEDIVEGIEDLLPRNMLEEFQDADENLRWFVFDDIVDYLNEIAPEGVSFGAQEGDGACFGFWNIDDMGD